MENDKLKIVVLGAGYASLSFLKSLSHEMLKKAQIKLITNNPYHYFSVLLHEVAVGNMDKNATVELKKALPKEVELVVDTVTEIKQNEVITKNSSFGFDKLIVGLGFNSEFFNIKGADTNSLTCGNYKEALAIKERIASLLTTKTSKGEKVDIAICGGGFSGVELVSSLAQKVCEDKKLPKDSVNIYCIEAMPDIIAAFPKELINVAKKRLDELGVILKTDHKILEIKQDSITCDYKGSEVSIKTDLAIWLVGVKGNAVIGNSPILESARNRVAVTKTLNAPRFNHIFIVGDCSFVKDDNDKPLPPTAQLAIQQGKYLAREFTNIIEGKSLNEFKFISKGMICSLGEDFAIGVGADPKKLYIGKGPMLLKRNIIEAYWRYKVGGMSRLLKG
ncbi:hypothetical protein BKH43_06825 [Helicobacter sp. 13S00401-1]|uniref:NAD(P)/FAD-dependent oxidoreductase n=1 Tax=Helicobacter sp. 13S00401-1 TaxID=1905758 RepID=UPI000BA6F7A4|nr:NAD(P)/FAD-dependent oxidoreductase [Helicobacter sp. 13S00401-1]PAF49357.1 hypothetical protein BKH43_06825 [Helicobacter sp. 13S00401-1]